jgi:hypothetical protein
MEVFKMAGNVVSFSAEMARLEQLSDLGITQAAPVAQVPAQPELSLDSGAVIEGQEAIRRFVMAGNSTFTLVSRKTGTRFTYKVQVAKDGNMHFVKALTGQDNENSFTYFGYIRRDVFLHGKKSRIGIDAPSVKAFAWFWRRLVSGGNLAAMEFYHEGHCGRCGRKLTVPESIRTGLGPECAGRV